jgi:OPA family sugar phosphate sensor protein UhpC-like MFS transporter
MPFAITGMRKDLGFEMTDLGTLGSSFALSFSIAKVFGGMAADLYSARFLLCSSLLTAGAFNTDLQLYFSLITSLFTGLMNVCFGLTSHLFIFSLLWAVNGACQGMHTTIWTL